MSSNQRTSWRSVAHGLILDEKRREIFLLQDNNRFFLPSVEAEGGRWEGSAAKSQIRFQRLLGSKVNVLYRQKYTEDASLNKTESYFVLEMLDPIRLEGQWFGREELDGINLVNKDQKMNIHELLMESESRRVPAKRPPWARAGWFANVSKWIEEQLVADGHQLKGPLEPVKNWSLSCLLRAPSVNGNYYFKTSADLPLFVNEARIVEGLGRLFPQNIPLTVATDINQDWLLMSDAGELVGWGAPIEERKGFIAKFGQLQRKSSQQVENLLQIGCLDRRLNWLESQIDRVIDSSEVERSLRSDEINRLILLSSNLKDLCSQLAAYDIPETIVHGDLHGDNVSKDKGEYIYFDWTDACISHPFFDMLDIFVEKEESTRQELRDHYLMGWMEYEPIDRLRSAWDIARVLAAVNQAISYNEILVNIEEDSRHELDWGLPFWLRKVIDYYDTLRSENV